MPTPLEEKLKNYKPSAEAVDLITKTPLLFLVGPSGAGKDTLNELLIQTGKYHHIVSHTTRQPRINHGVIERDGVDYHFISMQTAEKMLDEQAFIEAKLYSGNIYGTSVSEIKEANRRGLVAMTDLEVQGVAEYKAIDPDVMAVFLLPPDFKTWQERLQRRYGDVVDLADARLRLQTAMKEIDELFQTDYYQAVINDDMSSTYRHIEAIINSSDHKAPDEEAARKIARKLQQDVERYLAETA